MQDKSDGFLLFIHRSTIDCRVNWTFSLKLVSLIFLYHIVFYHSTTETFYYYNLGGGILLPELYVHVPAKPQKFDIL